VKGIGAEGSGADQHKRHLAMTTDDGRLGDERGECSVSAQTGCPAWSLVRSNEVKGEADDVGGTLSILPEMRLQTRRTKVCESLGVVSAKRTAIIGLRFERSYE